MKNVAYEASDRCRVNNRFANAPVGIRTRARGSTGRDHRPLDHRGSGRRKVRSLIILFLSDAGAFATLLPITDSSDASIWKANSCGWLCYSRALCLLLSALCHVAD